MKKKDQKLSSDTGRMEQQRGSVLEHTLVREDGVGLKGTLGSSCANKDGSPVTSPFYL